MRIANGLAPILAAALCLASCAKDERGDAARLAQALSEVQPNVAEANRLESGLIDRARTWTGAIIAAGAGHDAELDRNTAASVDIAKAATDLEGRLEKARQALTRVRLRSDYPREVRARLTGQLAHRLSQLQQFRSDVNKATAQFRAYAKDRDYNGDTVPDIVRKVDALLGSWPEPGSEVDDALADVRQKYGL